MLKRLKNIKARPMVSHVLITLAYPAARAVTAPEQKLLLFTDALTIIAVIMLIGGVIYGFVLHGDFDISGFVLRRGRRTPQDFSYQKYKQEQEQKREDAFNYPLFLGILYLLVALVIAYVFY